MLTPENSKCSELSCNIVNALNRTSFLDKEVDEEILAVIGILIDKEIALDRDKNLQAALERLAKDCNIDTKTLFMSNIELAS